MKRSGNFAAQLEAWITIADLIRSDNVSWNTLQRIDRARRTKRPHVHATIPSRRGPVRITDCAKSPAAPSARREAIRPMFFFGLRGTQGLSALHAFAPACIPTDARARAHPTIGHASDAPSPSRMKLTTPASPRKPAMRAHNASPRREPTTQVHGSRPTTRTFLLLFFFASRSAPIPSPHPIPSHPIPSPHLPIPHTLTQPSATPRTRPPQAGKNSRRPRPRRRSRPCACPGGAP